MWVKILDTYAISDYGRVRNIKTGREIKRFIGKDGYYRVQIAGKTRLVHRLVAMTFVPADPGKDFVNHKDGNKANNSRENLEWCTRSENMRHAYCNELKKPCDGVKNGRCKLSEADVKFIRSHYVSGDRDFGAKALAEKFGVARQTISAVVNGQNWNKSFD